MNHQDAAAAGAKAAQPRNPRRRPRAPYVEDDEIFPPNYTEDPPSIIRYLPTFDKEAATKSFTCPSSRDCLTGHEQFNSLYIDLHWRYEQHYYGVFDCYIAAFSVTFALVLFSGWPIGYYDENWYLYGNSKYTLAASVYGFCSSLLAIPAWGWMTCIRKKRLEYLAHLHGVDTFDRSISDADGFIRILSLLLPPVLCMIVVTRMDGNGSGKV
ncbi:hypothetical protein TWF696_001675 [Orbilia brochopaga]|uniref:Uncharacterized protein n=1 Tax=Orbilia brochopaga TaxID=3140254 RepID=A0AAV9U9V0_9PEZI